MIGVVKKIVFPENESYLMEIIGLITQIDDKDPTIYFLKNDFPFEVRAKYNGPSDYLIYDPFYSNKFLDNKTGVSISQPDKGKATSIQRVNVNEIRVQTSADGILHQTEFRITMKRSDYPKDIITRG